MKTLISLSIIFILAGCATTANYKEKLASLNGATEEELIKNWGSPKQSQVFGDRKYLTYFKSKHNMILTAHGGIGSTKNCRTTFQLEDGIVKGATFEGRLCKSR